MIPIVRSFGLGAVLLLSSTLQPSHGAEATLTTLLDLDSSNGTQPWASLVMGQDGYLYGTTEQGGLHGGGTVFRISTAGAFTLLHSFAGGTDGAYPKGTLLEAPDGTFYGTTTDGGNPLTPPGDGTVFKVTPLGEYSQLATFSGTNGSYPWAAPLALGLDGNLYGTTAWGGTTGAPPVLNGTIFRVSPAGQLESLFTFHFSDGFSPYGGLLRASDGNFYGTTPFRTETTTDGSLFRFSTNGVLATIAGFNGMNGSLPFGTLMQGLDGNLYGTTVTGGASWGNPNSVNRAGFGTIFKVTPGGNLETLFSFHGTNGSYPYSQLVQDELGNLYGTAAFGGPSTNEFFPGVIGYAGVGTIFRLAPDGTFTTLFEFGHTNGSQIFAGLTRGPRGTFYGTTLRGGKYDLGTIYRLQLAGTPPLPSPPTIDCPRPLVVECREAAQIDVSVRDLDGDPLTVVWTVNGRTVQTDRVPAGTPVTVATLTLKMPSPAGTNWVEVTVRDPAGQTASCTTQVTVADQTPPRIVAASAWPNVLWPPNHQMVTVRVRARVHDNCSDTRWKIVSVRSNDPAGSRPDIRVTGDHTVQLRAERSGRGEERQYDIFLRATDSAGNESAPAVVRVVVPKSQAKHRY